MAYKVGEVNSIAVVGRGRQTDRHFRRFRCWFWRRAHIAVELTGSSTDEVQTVVQDSVQNKKQRSRSGQDFLFENVCVLH